MKKELISIPDLDFQYKLWKNRISFYANEIKLFKDRLESLILEHQLEVNDEIELLKALKKEVERTMNEIKIQEESITCYSEDYPINRNHTHYLNHKALQKMKNDLSMEFIKLIKKLERKFGDYLFN